MDDVKCYTECKKDECEYVKGNLSEFEVKENDCEIRVDLIVKEVHNVRVWGQVTTCEGRPVEDALVKLVKVVYQEKKIVLVGVAHTITDCQGFYQFDICEKKEDAEYIVIVGKAAVTKDRIICENVCKD